MVKIADENTGTIVYISAVYNPLHPNISMHNCGRSDIVVISMNFNSCASLATLFNTKLYILHKYWFCLTFITVGKRAI